MHALMCILSDGFEIRHDKKSKNITMIFYQIENYFAILQYILHIHPLSYHFRKLINSIPDTSPTLSRFEGKTIEPLESEFLEDKRCPLLESEQIIK
jgi:hypothetical protein